MNIVFQNVDYCRKKFALQEILFEVREGYITALVGKNGSGKTTLFHMLLDQKADYKGTILADGMDWRQNRTKLLNKVGFVSDEQKFFMERSAFENAEMLQYLYDQFSMEIFQEHINRMGVPVGSLLKNMSRGEYIKYQLAFAVAHYSQLYLLDEATAGMDVVFKKDFFRMLHELLVDEHCAVLMSTHILDDIKKHMDYIVQIEDGRIISQYEVGA